ncbi:hypothetical protein [Martelella mediterranea]|uniref:hypothetical protein n=1 Tax=Martelella mediterranea TaxID=293089 RepID=UPI0012BA77B5|nr:hypothetical protein [Martelella mediterranea]
MKTGWTDSPFFGAASMFEGGAFVVHLHKGHGMFELRHETLNDKTIQIIPIPMNPRVECDTLEDADARPEKILKSDS